MKQLMWTGMCAGGDRPEQPGHLQHSAGSSLFEARRAHQDHRSSHGTPSAHAVQAMMVVLVIDVM